MQNLNLSVTRLITVCSLMPINQEGASDEAPKLDIWKAHIGKAHKFKMVFEEISTPYILFKDIICVDSVNGVSNRLLRDHMWLRNTKKFKKLDDRFLLVQGVELSIEGKLNRYRTKDVVKMPSRQPLHVYRPDAGEWRYTITNIKSIIVSEGLTP